MLAKWLNWSLLTAVNWIQDVPSHLQRAQRKTDECESLQLVLSAKTAENITVVSKSPKLSGSTGLLRSTVKYTLGSHKKEDFKCKWRVGESKGGLQFPQTLRDTNRELPRKHLAYSIFIKRPQWLPNQQGYLYLSKR